MCAGALATSDDGAWVCLTNKELGFRDGMKEDVDVDSRSGSGDLFFRKEDTRKDDV